MFFPCLLLFATPDADAVIKRCETFYLSPKSLSVRLEVTSTKMPGKGTGTFVFRRPSDVAFKMKWGVGDYSYWGSATGGLEVEASERAYDESRNSRSEIGPLARISIVPISGYPAMLLPGNLSQFLPTSGTKKLVGKEPIAGVSNDHVQISVDGPQGKVVVDMWVSPNGALSRYDLLMESPMEKMKSSIVFSGYSIDKPLPPATFVAVIPRGFMPHGFEDDPTPIQPGEPMPLAGWVESKMGAVAELAGGDQVSRLFVVVSSNCEPSLSAVDTVRELASTIPTVVLNTTATPAKQWAAAGLRVCHDPSGKSLAKLRLPGTPLFILTNSKGVVKRLWYGFDVESREAFKKDVLREAAQ